jgi:hypothetical protein
VSVKQKQVAVRRERLVEQAAAQRMAMGQAIEPWRAPLELADQGVNALRYVRRHPEWLIGGIVLLAVVRPRALGTWLGRGWVAWRLLHKLRDS